MASILQKEVIPIFGHCNLSIPLLQKIHHTAEFEALSRFKQHSLMFHTMLIGR